MLPTLFILIDECFSSNPATNKMPTKTLKSLSQLEMLISPKQPRFKNQEKILAGRKYKQVFALMEEAKKAASYVTANAAWSWLFLQSLDDSRIRYVIESQDSDNYAEYSAEDYSRWYDIGILTFQDQAGCIVIPFLSDKAADILGKFATFEYRRRHNRKFSKFVTERDLEAHIDSVQAKLFEVVPREELEKAVKQVLKTTCDTCPMYVGMYSDNYQTPSMHCTLYPSGYDSPDEGCSERPMLWNDSRAAFHQITGKK